MSEEAKQRSNQILDALLPFAEQMLKKHGEFFPFAAGMTPSGEIAMIGGGDLQNEKPPCSEVLDFLKQAIRKAAALGEYQTTGIAVDVRIRNQSGDGSRDAVCVYLEDADGYSIEVYFPYARKGLLKKEVIFEAPTANLGKKEIFVNIG